MDNHAAAPGRRLPRWLRALLISLVVLATVGSGLVFATGTYRINPEPGTIHVFGSDYRRFTCCLPETWSHGPQTLAVAQAWLLANGDADPVIVRLSEPWGRFGFADSDTQPPFPPCRVLLKEGADLYFPYALSGGCGS
jgi:hypothetical protein